MKAYPRKNQRSPLNIAANNGCGLNRPSLKNVRIWRRRRSVGSARCFAVYTLCVRNWIYGCVERLEAIFIVITSNRETVNRKSQFCSTGKSSHQFSISHS
ncbi:unnamed protein product [Dicrocoelium dendriticum]|nr:unnamed protein product [Dicrocoelium dendriticum]